MTWLPIWTTAIKTKFTSFPLVISSLSFGYVASIFYGDHSKDHLENLKKEEQQAEKAEMSRWSSSLQDPTSLNYQPFTFINK